MNDVIDNASAADDLLPDRVVRARLGGVTAVTLSRWRLRGILPPPIKINGRNYQRRGDVERAQHGMGSSATT